MSKATHKLADILLVGAGVLALTVAGAMPADAARAKQKANQARAASIVTAVSLTSQRTISGPVRRGQFGDEVRMPSGTWISCKGDCRETLRQETVDFWERQEQRERQNN